jgi:hypothetical protein
MSKLSGLDRLNTEGQIPARRGGRRIQLNKEQAHAKFRIVAAPKSQDVEQCIPRRNSVHPREIWGMARRTCEGQQDARRN